VEKFPFHQFPTIVVKATKLIFKKNVSRSIFFVRKKVVNFFGGFKFEIKSKIVYLAQNLDMMLLLLFKTLCLL